MSSGDHPHSDPGDGRTECLTCGKWIFEITHSCKGVPVTEAAKARASRWVQAPEPGACGDPKCYVLHDDPANPIHPPWYVDSRTPKRERRHRLMLWKGKR